MNQVSLFEDSQLERVKSSIGKHVLAFITYRGAGRKFHASDLCNYVWMHEQCAPESPGRIMRQLRLQGYFDYDVVDRSKALYKITRVSHG